MRVALILTDISQTFDHEVEHVGVMILAACLKRAGHEVAFRSFRRAPDRVAFQQWLQREEPGLVAFSTVTNQWRHVGLLCRWAKEALPATPVLVGGYHATLAPDDVLANEWVDLAARGEGDEAIVELCDALARGADVRGLANFWVKSGGAMRRNDMRPLLSDLDALPYLDHGIYGVEYLLAQNRGRLHFQGGRGCPYLCTYCSLPAVNEMQRGKGATVRRFSPERVVAEIKAAHARYAGFEYVAFVDETFTIDKRWAARFAEVYGREVGLPFEFMTSARVVTPELYRALRAAGADLVRLGVESGNEWLRNEVLRRDMSDADIRNAFAWAEAAGIRQGVFAMVGLPHETPEMAEQTIALLRELRADEFWLTIFYPFPRTALHDRCVEKGWLSKRDLDTYFAGSPLDMPAFPAAEIERAHLRMVRVATEAAAEKHPIGRYDLLVRRGEAVIEAGAAPPAPDFFMSSYPGRFWLCAPPPATLRWELEAAAEWVLDAAIGLDESEYARDGGPVRFAVRVDGEERFARTLDVFRRPEDRGWHPVEVALGSGVDGWGLPPLPEGAGGRIVLELIITALRPGADAPRRAGWGRPHLRHAADPPYHRPAFADRLMPRGSLSMRERVS